MVRTTVDGEDRVYVSHRLDSMLSASDLRLLKETRERAGITQEELAKRIGESQSFVSKCERGERRLDVVELRAVCEAIGVSFRSFARQLDDALGAP